MTKHWRSKQPREAEHGEWPLRLVRMSTAVDAWRKRTEDPVAPEPRSSLATDSIEGLNVENLIWYSMCISAEHLDFALDAMRATSTMYPTAYMTVARTAFVAAVNAVWVLAPSSRQQRRERALELRADDLRTQLTAVRDVKMPQDVSEAARTEFVEQLRERQADLQKVATALGIKQGVAKIRFNQTRAIDWVAERMHGVDNDLLIAGTQFVWRSGSAAAHAQYHFGIMRMDRSEVTREEPGSSIVKLRGDLETDVGPALAAATMTLSEAFRLYDLRRVRHEPAVSLG